MEKPLSPPPVTEFSTQNVALSEWFRAIPPLMIPQKSPEFLGVPTAPTAPTGTNTDQLSTTAFTIAAVNTTYTSAEQSIVAAALITTNHGLSATPSIWSAVMRCKSAEHGYSVGDEISIDTIMDVAGVNVTTAFASSTAIGVTFLNLSIRVCAKGSASLVTITAASWIVVFRARL